MQTTARLGILPCRRSTCRLRSCQRSPDGAEPDRFPVGSLYPVGTGTLRVALDSALSSPSGLGIAVVPAGTLSGVGVSGTAADMLDGFRRSTAMYSVLEAEWPEVRRALEARLR